MKPGIALGALALLLSVSLNVGALADTSTASKLKAFADLYPEVFETTIQTVSHKPTGGKPQAVALLIESFNGNTNVDELSAVLRPGDMGATAVKSGDSLKQLLALKGITMAEYQELTHNLATNPELFAAFYTYLDKSRMQLVINQKVAEHPDFVKRVNSPDHQAIVKQLIANFKK